MIPAVDRNIPILIKNTLNPSAPGTVIAKDITPHDRPITGIASIKNIALINVEGNGMIGTPGIASKVFGAFADAGINVYYDIAGIKRTQHLPCIQIRSGGSGT